MYERFTDRARKVMQLANQEAQRYNHEYIGTEHILLGLIKEGSGVAASVLKNLDVDLRTIRREVEKVVRSGPDMVTMGKLPQTPGAKKVIEYSMEEARNLNLNYLGTEHILLGLLREQEGVAAQVLMSLGVKLEEVREEVLKILDSGTALDDWDERRTARGVGAQSEVSKGGVSDRFTDRARKVMQLANQEAQRFNHEYVCTEHILLGLIKEGSGAAANVLKDLDVDLVTIRLEVEKLVQSRPDMVTLGKLPQTPRAKNVIEYAMQESRNLNFKYVGTEHILLGLLREHESLAAQILMNLGLKLDDVRAELVKRLDQGVAKIKTYLAGDVGQSENESPALRGSMYGEQIGRRTPVVTGIAHDYFTDRTLKVMQLAKQAAQRSNRGYLGTGHVLLGLIEEGQGVAAIVLKNLGFDLQTTLAEVEKLWPSATEPVEGDKLILSPETKKAIELARDEARKLNHRYIGTESLLLGLLVEEEGTAARALVKLGRTLEEVRAAVLWAMGRGSAPVNLTDQQIDKVKTDVADQVAQADKEDPALPGSMYDRFTDRARGVMQLANQQAKQLDHEYIGTEHILLGLVSEGKSVAANVLTNLNLELKTIRSEVGRLVQRGPDRVAAGKLPLTPRAKKVLMYAAEESRDFSYNYVGTEHLLLGLLREREGVAAQVLMNLGLKFEEVRKEVLTLLGNGIEGGEAE